MSDFIKVKEGISGSISHEIINYSSVDSYIADQIDRISACNPHLMKELCSLAIMSSDRIQPKDPRFKEKLRSHIVGAGIVVYRMLESQLDADELSDLTGE